MSTPATSDDMSTSRTLQAGEIIKPYVTNEQAIELVHRLYGLTVTSIQEMVSYDDRNFHVQVENSHTNPNISSLWPHGYTLKVLNRIESKMNKFVEEQNSLQQYLANKGLAVPVPIPNVYGSMWSTEELPVGCEPNKHGTQLDEFAVRLFTFLPGTPMINVPYTEDVLFQFGQFLGRFHSCIQGFHSKVLESRISIWSLNKVPSIEEFMFATEEKEKRELVMDIIEAFKNRVLSRVDTLPQAIIHGDFNENNVLVLVDAESKIPQYKVYGLLDFGDIHKAPLMFDVAMMMAYAMIECTTMDPLMAAGHALAGYLSEKTLTEEESSLLLVCMAARCCQSLVMGAYTHYMDPTNSYVLQTSRKGWILLRKLWKADWDSLYSRWKDIIRSKNKK